MRSDPEVGKMADLVLFEASVLRDQTGIDFEEWIHRGCADG